MAKTEFMWTDELVTKIVADAHRDGFHKEPLGIYDRVQNFKQKEIKEKESVGLIGVSIRGNVVDYENTASIKTINGKATAISMDGQIFLPTKNDEQPKEEWSAEHLDQIVKDFQPLSGEYVTLEECERRERDAWWASRTRANGSMNQLLFSTFSDYKKQSIKS